MKNILILILFTFISCKKIEEPKAKNIGFDFNTEEKNESSNFKKIKYSLKYNYLDSISKHIIPNRKFDYWQFSTYYQELGGGKITNTILKQGGNLSLRNKIKEKFVPAYIVGIFQGGHPSFRCNYITTVEKGKINYLKTEEEFRDFLGKIDNLEEAILLSRTYGYLLDLDIKGSEFVEIENGYILHLMKYHEFPLRKESVEITINKEGFIKTKSLGIYCEGAKCNE